MDGETNSVLGGALIISRSNVGTNSAGSYTGVLTPSGLTAANYTITSVNGNYTIVPADQLLVKVNNISTSYGTGPSYVISSAQYLNNNNVVTPLTLSNSSGNTYTYADGVGGTATFTLTPTGATSSTSGNINVGNYTVSGSNSE